jgi:hypothetical protein
MFSMFLLVSPSYSSINSSSFLLSSSKLKLDWTSKILFYYQDIWNKDNQNQNKNTKNITKYNENKIFLPGLTSPFSSALSHGPFPPSIQVKSLFLTVFF